MGLHVTGPISSLESICKHLGSTVVLLGHKDIAVQLQRVLLQASFQLFLELWLDDSGQTTVNKILPILQMFGFFLM